MVQFFNIPQSTQARLSEQLGQALGQGVARNFPQPEQMVQRRMLSEALGKVGEIAKDPNANPIDILTQTMQAGAGIPGFERYAMPLMEKMLQMSAYQQPLSVEKPQVEQTQMGGFEPALKAKPGQMEQQPNELPGMQLGEYIPVDISNYIDNDQKQKIVDQVGRAGGDVNLVKQRINEFNQGLIDYNKLVNSNVDRKFAQIQRQRGMEEDLKGFLDKQLPPNIPESRKNIYYDIVKKELPDSPDLTSAYQKASKKINAFEKQIKEIPSKIPEAGKSDWVPDIGMNQMQKKAIRQGVKNLLDIDPLAYPILEEMFKEKGHMLTEISDTLRPLPDNINKLTKEAGDYRDYMFPKRPMTENQALRLFDEAEEKQKEELPKLAKSLKKSWNEDISLINLWTELKKKGWQHQNIQNLFDEIQNQGIELSQQQQAERTQLTNPLRISIRKMTE